MAKQIIFSDEARQKLLSGIKKLYDAVRVTMGPKGRNALIDKKFGAPTITNDGVTIAKEIELADPYENMGAQLVKEVATKTNDIAGDGTTTATVLATAIVQEGLKNVTAGTNPIQLKRGIEVAVEAIIETLNKLTKIISTKEEIAAVASISAQDPRVGELIAEVMDVVGKDGVITVEEGQTLGLHKKVVEGMQFDNGYISPYMVTDTTRMESVFQNPHILITDKKISSIQEILPLLEKLSQQGKKDLVIIAEDIDGEALATLVVNKLRGSFNALAIKAPAFGDRRKAILKDIATLTGGRVISEEVGLKLENTTIEDLGQAHKVVADKNNTTIVDGQGKKEDIDARIEEIKNEINNSDSEFDREKLQERLAKLSGGVAVIEVGAATEVELKEKKHRIEDALSATRAAVEEGIVPGGGTALIRCIPVLDKLEIKNEDEKVGVDIVRRALEYPAKQIADNAGLEGAVIVDELKKQEGNIGYNALDNKFEDLMVANIIDPKKVTRSALENAASIAAMFLTTETAITDIQEEKSAAPAMPAAPGMGGMGGMGGMY